MNIDRLSELDRTMIADALHGKSAIYKDCIQAAIDSRNFNLRRTFIEQRDRALVLADKFASADGAEIFTAPDEGEDAEAHQREFNSFEA